MVDGHCSCGERLLLIRPRRTRCERCRIGRPTTALWHYADELTRQSKREAERVRMTTEAVMTRLAEMRGSGNAADDCAQAPR